MTGRLTCKMEVSVNMNILNLSGDVLMLNSTITEINLFLFYSILLYYLFHQFMIIHEFLRYLFYTYPYWIRAMNSDLIMYTYIWLYSFLKMLANHQASLQYIFIHKVLIYGPYFLYSRTILFLFSLKVSCMNKPTWLPTLVDEVV